MNLAFICINMVYVSIKNFQVVVYYYSLITLTLWYNDQLYVDDCICSIVNVRLSIDCEMAVLLSTKIYVCMYVCTVYLICRVIIEIV